jgi:hypothetical protein
MLLLHEAIAVCLLSKPNRTANAKDIANLINKRSLYVRRDKKPLPEYQVVMRASLSGGKYKHLFEVLPNKLIRLRNL